MTDATDLTSPTMLLRELNHRVKNNFQIILSLMNLQKRMLPPERRDDTRFIEDHVQAMSVAYRLVYATGSISEVSLAALVTEVLSGLRQVAGLDDDQLRVETPVIEVSIDLDHALALALYLAILLPPYLDAAAAAAGNVTVRVTISANLLTLSVDGVSAARTDVDRLRARLMHAYAGQLNGEIIPATGDRAARLQFAPTRSLSPAASRLE